MTSCCSSTAATAPVTFGGPCRTGDTSNHLAGGPIVCGAILEIGDPIQCNPIGYFPVANGNGGQLKLRRPLHRDNGKSVQLPWPIRRYSIQVERIEPIGAQSHNLQHSTGIAYPNHSDCQNMTAAPVATARHRRHVQLSPQHLALGLLSIQPDDGQLSALSDDQISRAEVLRCINRCVRSRRSSKLSRCLFFANSHPGAVTFEFYCCRTARNGARRTSKQSARPSGGQSQNKAN